MSSNSFEPMATIAVYTATILGVMYWSGGSVERTVYNRYIVRPESVSVATSDLGASARFLRDVLQFAEIVPKVRNPGGSLLFQAPGGLYLSLGERRGTAGHDGSTEIVFRVRNGFPKLHQFFERRLRDFNAASKDRPGDHIPPNAARPDRGIPSITPISERPAGEEFTVQDPDGNRFVFFRPVRRSLARN